MTRKKVYSLILGSMIAFLICLSSLIYWMLFTSNGAGFIVKVIISRNLKSETIIIRKIEGSIIKEAFFQDILASNLKGLPEKSDFNIKNTTISLKSFNLKGLFIDIHNARLNIYGLESVFFHGSCKDGYLDFNLYSRAVDIKEIAGFFKGAKILKNITGDINLIDIYVNGKVLEPEIKGEFRIVRLSRDSFLMMDSPISFDLKIVGRSKLLGEVVLKTGSVSGPKTAIVKLQESKILFQGLSNIPSLDLEGDAIVDGVKINVIVKGTVEKPDLKFSSEPALPKEKILLMLATNKGWENVELALKEGRLSPEVAKDFIDYFLFAGTGAKINQALGLKGILLKYDENSKGIEARKDVSERADVTYSVEQSKSDEDILTTKHKVGSEYKVTNNLRFGAERELSKEEKTDDLQESVQSNDKVYLKYKKNF